MVEIVVLKNGFISFNTEKKIVFCYKADEYRDTKYLKTIQLSKQLIYLRFIRPIERRSFNPGVGQRTISIDTKIKCTICTLYNSYKSLLKNSRL